MLEFTQARLLVDDLAACRGFYTDVLGLKVGFENSEYIEFSTPSGTSIGLYGIKDMAEAIGSSADPAVPRGLDRGVIVFRVDNVDESAAELRRRGAEQVTAPADRPSWNLRTAHFRDPAGNLIELIANLK
jgi:lactoylglutathione lyase